MVDKKTAKKPIKTESKKVKETKSEIFLRLGKLRVEKVLKAMRILGNCSNRSNYEYTSEQIESMFVVIQLAIDNTFKKFTPSKSEQESFEF